MTMISDEELGKRIKDLVTTQRLQVGQGGQVQTFDLSMYAEIEYLNRRIEELELRLKRIETVSTEAGKPKKEDKNIGKVKRIILKEVHSSKKPIFPGTVAIKYNLDYQLICRAIQDMRKDGILE